MINVKSEEFKLKAWAKRIPLEDLKQYYEIENHTLQETCNHFNIGTNIFLKLLKFYNYKKPIPKRVELVKKTKSNKYNNSNYNNREKAKKTCLEKYNVENCSQIEGIQETNKKLKIEKYGTINNYSKIEDTLKIKYGSKENFYEECLEKRENTCLEKYGVVTAIQLPEIKEKAKENFKYSFNKKYGVDNYFQTKNAIRSNGSKNSKINLEFSSLLDYKNFNYSREINIKGKWYDFKVDNILIEINPTATHNSTWSLYNKEKGIDPLYHYNKTKLALSQGYKCICIWDWDDKEEILKILQSNFSQIQVEKPRRHLYNLKTKEHIVSETEPLKEGWVEIFDDGSIIELM